MAKSVDAGDLKSLARKGVPVRVRLRAPFKIKHLRFFAAVWFGPQFTPWSAIDQISKQLIGVTGSNHVMKRSCHG
jgi:hypothetical protein